MVAARTRSLGTLAKWKADGIGSNGALLVGYGTVRQAVMGMSDAKAEGAQLDSMRALVDKGMREGALGMSTGLYYAPPELRDDGRSDRDGEGGREVRRYLRHAPAR